MSKKVLIIGLVIIIIIVIVIFMYTESTGEQFQGSFKGAFQSLEELNNQR